MDTNFVSILMSGKNPITSALVPSFVFVVLISFILGPVINFADDINGLIEQSLVLVILSIIVATFLQYTNTLLFKFLEGYGFLSRFRFLKTRKLSQAHRLLVEREELRRQILQLEDKQVDLKAEMQLNVLRDKHYSVSARYDQMFPDNLESVLPTSFGNILRAAEDYASVRYGIESVTFWRMIIGVTPKEYSEKISEARNEVTFFVNCIFLSILSSVVFGIVAIANRSNIYVLGILFSLSLGISFYQASISSVLSFGEMIRGAYDLYRFDLLEKLNLPIPENSADEFYTWRNLGELVLLGASSLEFEILDYKQRHVSEGKEMLSESTSGAGQKQTIVVNERNPILLSLLFALLAFTIGIIFR